MAQDHSFGPFQWVLACFLVSLSYVSASITLTGHTVILNDVHYYVPPDIVGKVPCSSNAFPAGLSPITVLPRQVSTMNDLSSMTSSWKTKDDVYQDAFLESLFVQGSSVDFRGKKQSGMNLVHSSSFMNATSIPPGPYFVTGGGSLHHAYRLYSDVQGAFIETTITNAHGIHSVLPANLPGQSLAIAVPSRIYFTPTENKPLAGVRLGVKDIFDLAGLRTSNGNRAWYHLYSPANATASPVQNLIDAGAIVVGKMKTSQFANGETATADWVDYHSPFNPRGDGYQDPSSSSSGPGAGEGAYEFLDVVLGSDTGGSVRGPSASQGLYGNRPSWGLVDLAHTMPLAPELDTAGLLARDPGIWARSARAMYKENITFTSKYPSQIMTLGFPSNSNSTNSKDRTYLDFLAKLTTFLGGASVFAFNVTSAWASDNPSAPPLEVFLNTTYAVLITREQTKLVRDPFYAAYAAAHDGRLPFVDPVPTSRWAYGDSSESTIEEAVANKTAFMEWFNGKVLTPDAKTCSNSLLLYTSGGSTTYRNVYRDLPGAPVGFGTSRISVFAEVPDMVVPVGQTTFNSTITKHAETLPLTINIMAAKGCDGMIFSLVEDLLAAGIVKVSQAGMSNVDGGEVLYKRWQR